jgi:rhodanese-related sulfurtransferase
MQQFYEFAGNHLILFSVLVVILVLLGSNLWTAAMAGGRAVSAAQAVKIINRENAVVVDLRDDAEFARGHIIDAVHIPYAALAVRRKELEQLKDRPLILCCASGSFSAKASAELKKAGFESLYRLRGGILAWQNDNLPVTR